jgi:hypothetical protein
MNAYNERRSDPKNFGARITTFGGLVEKIWNFDVSAMFVEFSEAKDLPRIIFQIPGT